MKTAVNSFTKWAAIACALVFLSVAQTRAQNPASAPELQFRLGWAAFIDESLIEHAAFGGSARIYLTPRLSVEPQFLYLRGSARDQDYLFVANVAYDLRKPGKRAVPYLVAGAGVIHTILKPYPSASFEETGPTASAAAGVKFFLSKRVFVAPELRIGWEPIIQASASLGFVLDR